MAHLRTVCSEKTGIRKFGDRLAIALPQGEWGWPVWVLDGVPPESSSKRSMQMTSRKTPGRFSPVPSRNSMCRIAGTAWSRPRCVWPLAPGTYADLPLDRLELRAIVAVDQSSDTRSWSMSAQYDTASPAELAVTFPEVRLRFTSAPIWEHLAF